MASDVTTSRRSRVTSLHPVTSSHEHMAKLRRRRRLDQQVVKVRISAFALFGLGCTLCTAAFAIVWMTVRDVLRLSLRRNGLKRGRVRNGDAVQR